MTPQRILVIDDEEVFRQATVTALQRRGFETHEAADGTAGLELARRVLPDLVLCDVNMEQMDGYATLEALRQDPATATIPLILMTGMCGDDLMRKGMNLGADDFLEKPFTAGQLLAAVNARLKHQQSLRQSAERKLAELRTSLSLAMPHEMITPLNGIFGLAELIRNEAGQLPPAEISEMAGDILQAAEQLHRLVQNFLLYGHLEMLATDLEGQSSLRLKKTNSARAVAEDRARQRADKAGRGADLVCKLADSALGIAPDLFTKLVDELLDNAFKFSSTGTPVTLTAEVTGERYVFSIADCGAGMDPAQLASVGAYSQFDRRAREQQGSGLGLAICRRLVELHGGQFTLHSEKGAGTTVTVKLPVA